MKKTIYSILFIFAFIGISLAQRGHYSGWSLNGNTVGSTAPWLGTIDANSVIFKTNNIQRFKIDSLGNLKSYASFSIDASGGVNSFSPKNWSFQPWVGATSYPAFYISQNIPSFTNYCIGADSTTTIFNAPTNLFLRANGTSVFQAQTTSTTTANTIIFNAVNLPTVAANSFMPHAEFASRSIGWNAGTTTNMFKVLISADTYSANAAATITNSYPLWVKSAIQGTNMTITGNNACRFDGNVLNNGNLRVGDTSPPTFTLDVAGNARISGSLTSTGITNTGSISATTAMSCATFTSSGQINSVGAVNIGTMTSSGLITASSGIQSNGNITCASGIKSTSKTSGIGYASGSGSTTTQGTSRTTAVTCNSMTGQITLVSAAGSVSWQTFTVNGVNGANDIIRVVQKSGTDQYQIHVTRVAGSAFDITFATTGGTTVEQPVFSYAVISGQTN